MKVLSIDGGGVFGVAPAYMLRHAGDLSKFDFFAGTSIGSIVAARAAMGKVDDELLSMFMARAHRIFKRHWLDRLRPLRTPKFRDRELNAALRDLLPGRFGDLPKPMAVTAIDMNRRKLQVFRTCDGDDASMPLWEVCRASAAAQTYFSSWKGFSDGGPMANNPCMVAVTELRKKHQNGIRQIEVLSLGTGEDRSNHPVGDTDGWSSLRWGAWLIPAMLHGAGNCMHEQFARGLPLKRFERIEFERRPDWEMDDPGLPPSLLEAWAPQIEKGIQTIKEF